jgi:hypothetical protein
MPPAIREFLRSVRHPVGMRRGARFGAAGATVLIVGLCGCSIIAPTIPPTDWQLEPLEFNGVVDGDPEALDDVT